MGAQIAAHFANSSVPVYLFGMRDPDPGCPLKALSRLKKLKPAPLMSNSILDRILPATYEDDLAQLSSCDLIIEAIAESIDAKTQLYERVLPHLKESAILATNTSGLSLKMLSGALPVERKPFFCGIHFFNPPRYLPLVELISAPSTQQSLLDLLEGFLTQCLGKSVVRAKDTPGFIANRIGVFSMLITVHHAQRLHIMPDTVDALTGTKIMRAKSATFRTADVVGLDIMQHVVQNLYDNNPNDPWREYFMLPEWIKRLIGAGHFGQKTGRGIYQKVDRDILVTDYHTGNMRPSSNHIDSEVSSLLKQHKNISHALLELRKQKGNVQAEFLWAIHRDLFHYCAHHLHTIASSTRDIDMAIQGGFGWNKGPFELWQQGGWNQVREAINEDVNQGKTLISQLLPQWVAETNAAYNKNEAFAPGKGFTPPSTHPVYARSLYLKNSPSNETPQTIWENDSTILADVGDNIVALSCKTKMHTLNHEVILSIIKAVDYAEQHSSGLIIWQRAPNFCAGANLYEVLAAAKLNMIDNSGGITAQIKKKVFETFNQKLPKLNNLQSVRSVINDLQNAFMRLKHSHVPTVAAVQGLALGGGCEMLLHCNHVVAHTESYIGLVEIGVGVLPAGAGTKEMALRAAQQASPDDLFELIAPYFENIAMAKVSTSALEAQEMGYLRPTDTIIANVNELLFVAKQAIQNMQAADFAPPDKMPFNIVGLEGLANIMAQLNNLKEGGFISEHDYICASKIAEVICGGKINACKVEHDWLLQLEADGFCHLLHYEKSQDRIEHILKTGKPLRN